MDEGTRFLILSLDGGSFAIPISKLLEITMPRGLKKDVNLSAALFEGKYEFRGKWIPVLNAKKILKLSNTPGTAMLIVSIARGTIGIVVDAVTEIIDTDQAPVAVPRGVMNPSLQCYAGVIRHKGDLILLLNQDGLLQ